MGCSSYFDETGNMIPVTLIKIEECIVSKVQSKDKQGYNALQIASVEENFKLSKVNKAQKKIFTELKINPKRYLKEFRVDESNFLEKGTVINISHFKEGQFVDISGTSIGKGFAGSMKRHNFHGLRASHGVSISHRSHGSTGNSQDPGRVFKGKKMAGHMGSTKVTKQNLRVVEINEKTQLMIVKGSVPGKKNSVIFIKDAIKKSKLKWKQKL